MSEPDYEREYHPCLNGVHVCGMTPDEERPLTVVNIAGVPRWRFEQMGQAFGVEGDFDLVVDFMENGDCLEDFCIRRQSLDLMIRELKS